jgi:putative membrane protein
MLAFILAWAVAVLHVYILVQEMFLWQTPRVRRAFGLTPEFASASKVLAMNQGLYNGFLAAGLAWGLSRSDGRDVVLFFLGCVVVAGLFGAATAKSRRILLGQALPALVAIVAFAI